MCICTGNSFPCAGLAGTNYSLGGADVLDKGGYIPPLSYSDTVASNPQRCNSLETPDY